MFLLVFNTLLQVVLTYTDYLVVMVKFDLLEIVKL
jgi:hypothetical protein